VICVRMERYWPERGRTLMGEAFGVGVGEGVVEFGVGAEEV
jgi:hypothetical protein